jgi:integrase
MTDKDALTAFLADCTTRLRPNTVDRYTCALARHREEINLDTNDPNELKALKAFFNWCIDRGIRDTNPVARRQVVFGVRDRLLSDDEIKRLLAYEREPYSTIIKLLIYTGQRRGQFAQFDPSWVEDDVIVFPASIMKSARTHILPATPTVLSLIPNLGTYSGWSKSKRRMDEHTNVSDYVLHDFRRYFSSTMAKQLLPNTLATVRQFSESTL